MAEQTQPSTPSPTPWIVTVLVSFLLSKGGYVGIDAGEIVNQVMTIVTNVSVVVAAVGALIGQLRASKRAK